MLKLLRNRDYFHLWSGQTVSLVGDDIRDWALSLWIFHVTGSPAVLSISLIAAMAPVLFLAPFAGVWVDRWDRRRIMIVSDLIRAVLGLLMIPVLIIGQYWYLIVLISVSASVAQFFDPARGAMIPRVVGKDQLVAASSLGQTTRTLLQLGGPALGTLIYMTLGPLVSVSVDAVTFLVSAFAIWRIRTSGAVTRTADASAKPSFFAEFKGGLRYSMGIPPIRGMIIGFTVLFLGLGAANTLLMFVLDELGIVVENMAFPATVQAAATLVVSVVIGSVAAKLKRVPLLIPAGIAVVTAALEVLAFGNNLWWVVAGMAVAGFGVGAANIGVSATLQSIVPDEMRGRVFGVFNSLPQAAMMLSAAVAGQLAMTISSQTIMAWSGLLAAAAVLLLLNTLKDVEISQTIEPAKAGA